MNEPILNPFKKGDKLIIPKGAVYHTRGKERTAGRTYTVKIATSGPGYLYREYGETKVVTPYVSWAGSGGYWCDLDLTEDLIIGNGHTPQVNTAAQTSS